jgi:quercetin dioxygenase-like cupin family protein
MRTMLRAVGACGAWLVVSLSAVAQEPPRPGPSLDSLVGSWVLTGTIRGAPTTHDVTAEWVLNREYLRIHEVSREKNAAGGPAYEAIILVGWDPQSGEYQCLWLDTTGGSGLSSPSGIARGRPAGDSIPFVWMDAGGPSLHNTFVYSRGSGTWRWDIDNETGGTRSPFARLTLARNPQAPLVPAAAAATRPDQLVWTPYPAGGVQASLLGDPGRAGTYVVRIRIPAGLRLAPHFHPDGRIVQVLSGTMYFAYGDSGDTTRLRAYPAGSLWTEPPGIAHYAWARDGEVVLQIVGTGPSGSRPAGAHQPH